MISHRGGVHWLKVADMTNPISDDLQALLIVNPTAGRGRGAADASAALASVGIDFDLAVTAHRGNATELAAQAKLDGRTLVIAAGGDGTVHEVANGIVGDGQSPQLGLLPLGSGCDYVRTFGVPSDLREAAQIIASGQTRTVDVGEVTVTTDHGQLTRKFVNIAEVGFGSVVAERAATLPRALGSAVYFFAFWNKLPGYVRCPMTVNDVRWPGVMNVVVATGQVFGGGMRIAPEADPSDGLFDVQVHHGTKLDYVRGIPKVYRGTHLPHPRIEELRTASLKVNSQPEAVVEADGEVLGRTPAEFRVIPGGLTLRV